LASQRNIIPLMLEGFDFSTPAIGNQLTGALAALKNYNGVRIPQDYFDEGMERLRTRFLNVPLTAVLHPASSSAQRAAIEQKAAANAAPEIQEEELTAQQWVERGYAATDMGEKLRAYNEAIRLKPDYIEAFNVRGFARFRNGDREGALQDYGEAIRLKPDYSEAFNNRGIVRRSKGDLEGAMKDYTDAIRLGPDDASTYKNRAIVLAMKSMNEAAIADYQKYLDLGGGVQYGDQSVVENAIRGLRAKLKPQ
jgi:tetratricopeptide (TPR) repeat protein